MPVKITNLIIVYASVISMLQGTEQSSFRRQYNEAREVLLNDALPYSRYRDKFNGEFLKDSWADKHTKMLAEVVDSALKEKVLWGKDENGSMGAYSLLCAPYMTLANGDRLESPFFRTAIDALCASGKFRTDEKLHTETMANLIDMAFGMDCPRDILDYAVQNVLLSDVLFRKWNDTLQRKMKETMKQSLADCKKTTQEPLLFFWLMDWNEEEKSQLANQLRPIAERCQALQKGDCHEWLALLILYDMGEKWTSVRLSKILLGMEYNSLNRRLAKNRLPFLTLIRREETVRLLEFVMKREDVVGLPKLFVEREGSLAHTAACCLAIMLANMPSIYDEAEHNHPEYNLRFPLGKRRELLAWLGQQKTFRFKPFNYYRTPRGEFGKKNDYLEGFSEESRAARYWAVMSFTQIEFSAIIVGQNDKAIRYSNN